MRQQTISDEGVLRATQVYGYDALDRLTTFTEGTLLEPNCYDAHGNRAVLQRVGLSPLIPNDGRSMLRYDGEDRMLATKPVSDSTWAGYVFFGDDERTGVCGAR